MGDEGEGGGTEEGEVKGVRRKERDWPERKLGRVRSMQITERESGPKNLGHKPGMEVNVH